MSNKGRRCPRGTLAERFWPKVDKRGPDECWEWTAVVVRGYGQIARSGDGGERLRAHRASWELHSGPVPDGLWVLHRCDNPLCVNPAHLWLGTHKDNIADRDKKGRQAMGEKITNAKLTADDVVRLRKASGTIREIAKRFGIGKSEVSNIRSRKVWNHVQ